MGLNLPKEGAECNICGAQKTDVGPMTDYKKYGYDKLLCKNCIAQIEKNANTKCPECDKMVGLDAMTEHDGKRMCQTCVKKDMKKGIKSKGWKNWIRENILKLIAIGLMALTAVITYLALIK